MSESGRPGACSVCGRDDAYLLSPRITWPGTDVPDTQAIWGRRHLCFALVTTVDPVA